MDLLQINKLEKAVVATLNLDGWDLEWTGKGYLSYDAKGKTSKGKDCVIEMKFRTKYYEEKMLEQDKYESLMSLDKNILKFYFVNDPKGNFMYWLNNIKLSKTVQMYCPDTTIWTKKRILKDVYLLKENQATIININKLN